MRIVNVTGVPVLEEIFLPSGLGRCILGRGARHGSQLRLRPVLVRRECLLNGDDLPELPARSACNLCEYARLIRVGFFRLGERAVVVVDVPAIAAGIVSGVEGSCGSGRWLHVACCNSN